MNRKFGNHCAARLLRVHLFYQHKTNQDNPNLFPIGNGFGFIIYLDEIV